MYIKKTRTCAWCGRNFIPHPRRDPNRRAFCPSCGRTKSSKMSWADYKARQRKRAETKETTVKPTTIDDSISSRAFQVFNGKRWPECVVALLQEIVALETRVTKLEASVSYLDGTSWEAELGGPEWNTPPTTSDS